MGFLMWVNIYLTVFYAFYWICLRKETFFQVNRWYFLSSVVLSFTLPLVDPNLFSFGKPELVIATLPELQISRVADLPNSFPAFVYIYLLSGLFNQKRLKDY